MKKISSSSERSNSKEKIEFKDLSDIEELKENLRPKQWGQKKLHILYQSLEATNNFTKNKLAPELNRLLKDKFKVLDYKKRDCLDYHIAVSDLLKTYINHIRNELTPDIIVLGEYSADNTYFSLENYSVIAKVGMGERSMTILHRKGNRNIHRITVHDGINKPIDWWRKGILEKRVARYNELTGSNISDPDYLLRRNLMGLRWKDATKYIGTCIEIMYANRYIAMVHVPNGKGDNSPKKRAEASLAEHNIPFVFMAGDLNINEKGEKNHVKDLPFTAKHRTKINTDVEPLLSGNCSYAQIQYSCNVKGATNSTASWAHDGLYSRTQDKTELSIIGSIWPIIDKDCLGVSNKEYYLMGDHKGFLMELTTRYEKKSSRSDSYYGDEYDNLSTCSIESLKDRDDDWDYLHRLLFKSEYK